MTKRTEKGPEPLREKFDKWLASNPSEHSMFGAFMAGVRVEGSAADIPVAYRWKWRADDERWAYGEKAPRQCFSLTPLSIAASGLDANSRSDDKEEGGKPA